MNSKIKIEFPDGWSQTEHLADDISAAIEPALSNTINLIAISPNSEARFCSNLVVSSAVLGPLKEQEWFAQDTKKLAEALPGFYLLDAVEMKTPYLQGLFRCGSYIADTNSVTMVSFSWTWQNRGYIATFTTETGKFHQIFPQIEEMIMSLHMEDRDD